MNALKDYVEWKLTHSDKTAEAEGYPLILEKCKKNKKMKDLKVYGNSVQNGTPTPENPIEVLSVGEKTKNLFNANCRNEYETNNVICKGSVITCTSTDSTIGYGIKTDVDSTVTLKAGITYTVSSTYLSGHMTSGEYLVGLFDANTGTWYKANSTIVYAPTRYANTYTNLRTATFIPDVDATVCCRVYGKGIVTDLSYGFMIHEGSEPLPYEPYGKYKIPVVQESFDIKNNILIEGAFSNNVNCLYDNGVYTFTRTEEFPNRFSGWFDVSIAAGSVLFCRYDVIETTCSNALRMIAEYTDGSNTTLTFWPYLSNASFKMSKDVARLRLYLEGSEAVGSFIKFKHLSLCVDERPTLSKTTHNLYLDSPLRENEYIDFKRKKVFRANGTEDVLCELPKPTAKTTVFTVDSTIEPSNMYGKYIKR